MATKVNITSPVGRIVMGSLYDPSTTDAEGKPLVVKTGPNAGQPRVNYFFALAIPKGPEPHWAHTPWGQQIWNVGNTAFPQAGQSPAFAWKIEDGDSQVPNKRGRKPCENEGWAGHWILKFSGGYAPKVYRADGAGYVQITDKDAIKPGSYVEVAFSVDGNGSTSQPGVYLNHSMVCFRAYGPEITFGPDVNAAGFGASPLPAGASMTPPPSAIPMPAMPAAAAPMYPGAPAPGMPQPAAMPAVPVMPNTGFVQVPPPAVPTHPGAAAPAVPGSMPYPIPGVAGANGVPGMMPSPSNPPAPPVPAARQMLPAANGIAYEAYIGQGWTDAQLVAHGMMAA